MAPISVLFTKCIDPWVLEFMVSNTDSEKYVEQLLELFNRFSDLVKEAFNDDPRFLTSRDKVSYSKFLIYSGVLIFVDFVVPLNYEN
jgi:hypothetical protein